MPQPSACKPDTPEKKKEKMGADLGNAVKSIPAYVEKSDFVTVVAPGCLHADRRDPRTNLRAKTCYRTYRNRGWCVLEVFASRLSRDQCFPVLLITSKEGTPEWFSPLETQHLAVGTSEFTCCQRNHIFGNKIVPCDRGVTRTILQRMIQAKTAHLFKLKSTMQARLTTCFTNWWLRTDSSSPISTENIDAFKTLLGWDCEFWNDENGVSILVYAVIRNNANAVQALLNSAKCTEERLNTLHFKNSSVIEF